MKPSNGSATSWFGNPRNDQVYLDAWRSAPLSYAPGQPIGAGWNVDRYEVLLGNDSSGKLFSRAARITLHNRFYPPHVMINTADYDEEDRTVQVGDCVLQRIRILSMGRRPVLETLTLNKITEVIDEPRRKGFTYATTNIHKEVGEWSALLEWRENGDMVLVIEVASMPRPDLSPLARRITRLLQLRAHQLSIQNFRALLSGDRVNIENQPEFIPARVLPVGMLLLALGLLALALRGLNRRGK